MGEYSDYQKKVIKRFYDNRDNNDRQRLSEIVTSLYLSSPGKKRENLWKSSEEIMLRLNVPASRVQHILKTKDPAILAEVVQDVERGIFPAAPAKPAGESRGAGGE